MHQTEKFSDRDLHYERLFTSSSEHIRSAITNSGLSYFSVFLRYVEQAREEETLSSWLESEFTLPSPLHALSSFAVSEEVIIPDYTYPEDIYAQFAHSIPREGLFPAEELSKAPNL
jgi:hypothetical protein